MRELTEEQQTSETGHVQTSVGVGKKLSAVILDFGNVISLPQDPGSIREMAALLNLPSESFVPLYFRHRSAYDSGTISDEEYWRILCGVTGAEYTDQLKETLIEVDHAGWSKVNPTMVEWIERLRRAGIKTAILSNMPTSFYQRVLARYAWIHLFDAVVISGELGMVKPDAEIFRFALSRLGTSAGETLFVDDLEPNVEGARLVGLEAVQFSDARSLGSIIDDRYGLPPVVSE